MRGLAYLDECIARLPKYSSPMADWELGGLPAVGVRCSEEPNAEVCNSLRVSEVRESLALLRDGVGDSSPNLEGTDDGHGAAGKRAALEMPLESKDAGRGTSRIDKPLPFAGDKPKPSRVGSSSRGEP